jgi:uncharacterized Fe-S radical SAM superfamily protein PflX
MSDELEDMIRRRDMMLKGLHDDLDKAEKGEFPTEHSSELLKRCTICHKRCIGAGKG